MCYAYYFFISFIIIFLSELGDKTQLLVLSFSTKDRTKNILLGVAIGTFFSHGLAIIFGSKLSSFQNNTFQFFLEFSTYISFLLFGIIGFIPKKDTLPSENAKLSLLKIFSKIKLNSILFIAFNIIIGELGDKTFLASLGLGIQYPKYKISLVLGSIAAMVMSNSFALFFGKFLSKNFNPKIVEIVSNCIFIIFGLLGFIKLI